MGLGALTSGSAIGCGSDEGSTSTGTDAGSAAASGTGATKGNTGGAGGLGAMGGAPNSGSAGTGATASSSGGAPNASGGSASGGTGGTAPQTGGAAGASTGGVPTQTGGAPGTGGLPSVRRPFLVGSSMRSSEMSERDDWMFEFASGGAATPRTGRDTAAPNDIALAPIDIADQRRAEVLAAAWLKDALEEHASIAAFARFTLLLLSVGAPPELVVASQRASLDEVRHTRACFALARRYGAGSVGPAPLDIVDSLRVMSLAEIAALTVAEGCVGETLGALMAMDQLERATDPVVVRILERLAKDEARHSELSWKFLAWALETGGAAVEEAARRAFRETMDAMEREAIVDYGVDVSVWHAHGRLTCAEARALSRRGIEDVLVPCMDALFGRASGIVRLGLMAGADAS